MIKIGGRWECVVEYLDRCIGQQKVVDVMQQGKTVWYVFENGHELPLLCFCCGESLVFTDLERSRRDMRGRRLEAMSYDMVRLQDGQVTLQFRLEFSKKGWLSRGISSAVALEAAARMRHPAGCPHKGGSRTERRPGQGERRKGTR